MSILKVNAVRHNDSSANAISIAADNNITLHSNTHLGDNERIKIGDSSDLQIYHDGSNSRIVDNGTGELRLQGTNLRLWSSSGENYLTAIADSTVSLYYDNSAKLATTSTGIDVTGTVTADQYDNDEALPTIRPSLLLDFANQKTLDPRITFTRASTATYYDGKTTVKAEENLLYPSEGATFTSTSRFTQENNTSTAPDGTSTATEIRETADNDFHDAYHPWSSTYSGQTTISAYVKLIGRQYFYIYTSTSPNYSRVFDLTNGTVQSGYYSSGSQADGSIVSVGNDWYRVSITFNSSNSGKTIAFGTILSGGNFSSGFTGDTSKGFYIWGIQVETRSSATAYTPTTSYPITKYMPVLMTASANVARFDHDPVTKESKGLLIEEQRTNLWTYSSDITNWNNSDSTDESNAIIAPDGTLTGDKLICGTVGSYSYIGRSISETSGTTYSFSVYAKSGTHDYIWLSLDSNASNYVLFDLSTGAVGSAGGTATGTITSVGNGWYRCAIIWAATSTASQNAHIGIADSSTTRPHTATGYETVYLWGAQVEAAAFPTSYISTNGSTVTRSADSASMTGTNFSSWYLHNGGTTYFQATPNDTTYGSILSYRKDGDAAFANELYYPHGSGNDQIRLSVINNGTFVGSVNVDDSLFTTDFDAKVAFTMINDDIAFTSLGKTPSTDTSADIPVYTQLKFGVNRYWSNNWNGTIKKFAFYPARLTDAQLQALTES